MPDQARNMLRLNELAKWLEMDKMDKNDEAFQLSVDLETTGYWAQVTRAKHRPGSDGYALWNSVDRIIRFATLAHELLPELLAESEQPK